MDLNQIISSIIGFLTYNHRLFIFYLPLGIIGIWRWVVWIIKRITSFFYRTPPGDFQGRLSIITPVYNENPDFFLRALNSWSQNQVDEIIAVIDYTDKINIQIFEKFQEIYTGAKLIITEKPGKRPALADGIKEASGEIVALVDSDTVWSPDIKNKLLGPFSDPNVGGLVTRQDVYESNTLARILFKILLDERYLIEYPFLATLSDALLCLSGRTAVYRRSALIDKLDYLVNETFLGKKVISGDDKTLTRLVQKEGWKTRYLRDVKVYTSGTAKLSSFLKQKLRWSRNGLRSDSKVIFSSWVWKKHKILALHMLDKFVSPLTLLLAPIYFVASIYYGHWPIAIIIALWWIISRAIKIYPHLKERPQDIFVLPEYVFMTFVTAIIKIYALFTVDVQGWITRWDDSRLKHISFFGRLPSYAATAGVILILSAGVFSYKNEALKVARSEKQVASIQNQQSIYTKDKPRMSDSALAKIKSNLTTAAQSDPYGYYIVKPGDTLALLRWKYNLTPAGRILDAKTKRRIMTVFPGQMIAIPAVDLRNQITIAKGSFFPNKPLRVTYDIPSNTIFLRQTGRVVRLANIRQSLPLSRRKLLEQTESGQWILRANLYVGKNVTLVLDGREVKNLRIKSDSNGFVWLRSESGNILISDTKITSWDENTNAPDTNLDDGRAFIVTKNSGRMDIINSDLGYLGYIGSPKRGGPFGGSYGVSWKLKSGSLRNGLITGVVLNSKFHDNFFGLYTFGATGMLIRKNEAYSNINYGFDPHDDSNNMLIDGNYAYSNGNHGIIISKRCVNNIISNNQSYNNRLHGIMLDRSSNNNLVKDNTVYGNVDGIAIYGSNSNVISGNIMRNNNRGIRLNALSSQNYFEDNQVFSNSRGIYIYGQSEKNILVNNKVINNDIGATIKEASNGNSLFGDSLLNNKKSARIIDSYDNNIQ